MFAGMQTGAGKRVANLAAAMAPHTEEILLCHQLDGSGIPEAPNLRVERIPFPFTTPVPLVPYPNLIHLNIFGFAWLRRRLKAFSYDAVEFQQNQPTLLADMPSTTIVVMHGSILGLTGMLPGRLVRVLGRIRGTFEAREVSHSDHVVAVSNYVRDELIRNFGISPTKVEVIPNGVDTHVFHPDAEDYNKLHERYEATHLLLGVGRFSQEKAFGNLIEAFALLRSQISSCKLILLGDGDSRSLQILAKKRGVKEDVVFHYEADQDKLAGYYAGCDVYIHPSTYDAAPLSLLEAMASGATVISSKAGGIPEAVDQGGLLLPNIHPDTIADATRELLEDSTLQRRLERIALNRVRTHYTWDRISEAYFMFLRKSLQE